MRTTLVAAVVASIVGFSAHTVAQAAIRRATNIPPEPLAVALRALVKDRDFQIVYSSELLENRNSHGATGELTMDEALTQILSGTGLEYRYLDQQTVTIVPISHHTDVPEADDRTLLSTPEDKGPGEGSWWTRLRLAEANLNGAQNDSSIEKANADQTAQEEPGRLEEVLVTAQKKSERLQDVPVPVSLINAAALTDSGQVLFRDYYMSVPGLNLSPNIEGAQMINVRGITTGGFSIPTVGIVIDDVPFGATAGHGAGNLIPDIDPGDLARIEVLRGPQGTLYGADSMGGLVKFVTKDPSTEGYSGRIEAGYSSVHNGAEPGFNLRASANIPLGERLAIRVSGYERQDPGYIDNILTNQKGVNEARSDGARLAALWHASDNLSVALSALYQDTKANGIGEVVQEPGLRDLQQNYIAGLISERTIQAYSAKLNWQLGNVNLVSLTGYNVNRGTGPFDFTPFFSQETQRAFGVTGSQFFAKSDLKKVTEEVRLSGVAWQRLDWVVGGFYTHENNGDYDLFLASVPATGQVVGFGSKTTFPDTFNEYAEFAALTFHFNDRFDIQVGGRESEIKVGYPATIGLGPLSNIFTGNPPGTVVPGESSSANAFTYLVTPRYRISPDLMIYARIASGYRPGGPNNPVPGVPSQVQPDKTQNYEIGLKGDFLDRALSIDASLYYIDWKNIQLSLQSPPPRDEGYFANGSAAKSEGVELSVAAHPVRGLSVTAWIDYDDAVLTESFPANSTTFGAPGDPLPDTPKFSSNLSLDQEISLGQVTGFVGATVSHVGDRKSVFVAGSTLRQDLASYTKIDLRAGVRADSWTVTAYVNNVADVRGLLNGGIGYIQPDGYVYLTPRTIGVNVARAF